MSILSRLINADLPALGGTVNLTSAPTFGGTTPKLVFISSSSANTVSTITHPNRHGRGVITQSGQWGVAGSSDHNIATTNTASSHDDNHCVSLLWPGGANFTRWSGALIPNGVQLTHSTGFNKARVMALIIGGDSIVATASGRQYMNSTAATNITTAGVNPSFVYLATARGGNAGYDSNPGMVVSYGYAGLTPLDTVRQRGLAYADHDGVTTAQTLQTVRSKPVCAYARSGHSINWNLDVNSLGTGQFQIQIAGTSIADSVLWCAVEMDDHWRVEVDDGEINDFLGGVSVFQLQGLLRAGLMEIMDGATTFGASSNANGLAVNGLQYDFQSVFTSAMSSEDNVATTNTAALRDEGAVLSTDPGNKFLLSNGTSFSANIQPWDKNDLIFSPTGWPVGQVMLWVGLFLVDTRVGTYSGTDDVTAIYEGGTRITDMYEGTTVIFRDIV